MKSNSSEEIKAFGSCLDRAIPSCGESAENRAGGSLPESSSLLVVSGHKSPFSSHDSGWVSDWTKTQRRLYHRVMSGFEMAKRDNDYLRVLTLTSSPDSGNFHRDFEVLKKRIRRKYGRFEYVAVRELTKSGLEHLHLAYRGHFMSQSWLSDTWKEIHNSEIVWIAKLYTWKLAKHLARYFIKEGFGRYWTSWKWVYKGFVRDWKRLVHEKGNDALNYWYQYLRTRNVDTIQSWLVLRDMPRHY